MAVTMVNQAEKDEQQATDSAASVSSVISAAEQAVASESTVAVEPITSTSTGIAEGTPAKAEQDDGFDDIAAELARIERMSQEEAAAIPSLDDGDETSRAVTVTGAVPSPTPSEETSNPDDELAAALAEVEQLSTKTKKDPEQSETTPAAAPATTGSKTGAPTAGSQRKNEKTLQFKIGKQEPSEKKESATANTPPRCSWVKPAYDFANRILDAINRPFVGLAPRTRQIIGLAAATTIAVCMLAQCLIPIVLPHRDAIQFLQERRAALDQPTMDEAPVETPSEQHSP